MRQSMFSYVLAGVAAAMLPMAASAFGGKKKKQADDCCAPVATDCCAAPVADCGGCAPACAPAAPATIKVQKWVDQVTQEPRTTYKHETKCETYTAYKTETYQEPVTSTITVNKIVCETVMECRTKCVKVPVWEDKITTKSSWKTVCYTEMKSKKVDKGHYECQEVPVREGFCARFKKKDPCACDAPKTELKKVWVPCMVEECYPVTKSKREKVCEQVCEKVCTYRNETVTEMVPVVKKKCVPECQTVTKMVCKTRCVPYTATRNVSVCVPVTEMVSVTKKVCVWEEVPAPACNPCAPAAAVAAPSCCH